MADLRSLNQQITAAWSAAPAAAPTKRPKRAIQLNGLASGNGSEASSPGPPDASQPVASSSTSALVSTGPEERTTTPSSLARRKRNRTVHDPEQLAAKYAPPTLRFASLGGLEPQITQLLEFVALPLLQPATYEFAGVPRPGGVLLHGVPGGGKTQLIKCLAGVRALFLPRRWSLLHLHELTGRNWDFPLSAFRHRRSWRACRASRKRHYETYSTRPRWVLPIEYVGRETDVCRKWHRVLCSWMRWTPSRRKERRLRERWRGV